MNKGVDCTGITVVFFCHDGKRNYLFNKRGKNCRDENGKWDVGGGGLDFDDKVETTLKKEIKEEYSTDVLEYEFLGFRDVHRLQNGKRTHWIALDFKVLVKKDQVRNGEPHKFDKIGWFKLNKLPKPTHSQLPKALKKYKDKL